jgi:DNA-binding CsgD family transcriptional regulator
MILIYEKLTKREYEVLYRASIGMKRREIANELGLTYNTVGVYIANGYRKLNVHRRTQLIAFFR